MKLGTIAVIAGAGFVAYLIVERQMIQAKQDAFGGLGAFQSVFASLGGITDKLRSAVSGGVSYIDPKSTDSDSICEESGGDVFCLE